MYTWSVADTNNRIIYQTEQSASSMFIYTFPDSGAYVVTVHGWSSKHHIELYNVSTLIIIRG